MTRTCMQETRPGQDETVAMFPRKGRDRGIASGCESMAETHVFLARNRRSHMLWKSPGSSGEGLASEPWQVIFHTCLSRLKRWRKCLF